ncbi:MAG: cysteine synthase A, partial [Tissierellia bacterium]|nr:cysteine synthase A [Tissierellia bacterium]
MKMIVDNILETIGNTPLVKIHGYDEENRAEVYAKVEYFNAGGSVKDRIALHMVESMESEGKLKEGDTIVEPTSGNTGVGLAMVSAVKGYNAVFVMPETMSIERRKLLKAYGAELILTEGSKGMSGAISKAEELVKEKGFVMLSQFENSYNPETHELSTGKEIANEFTELDAFVAGVGTGGTISGIGKVLKGKFPALKIIAIEPDSSPVLSGGEAGPHGIQGIGAGFIPKTMNTNIADEIMKVSTEDSIKMARDIAKTNGLLLGISSGAALYGAISMAKRLGKGNKVVFIAPDSGERYLSTELFN